MGIAEFVICMPRLRVGLYLAWMWCCHFDASGNSQVWIANKAIDILCCICRNVFLIMSESKVKKQIVKYSLGLHIQVLMN